MKLKQILFLVLMSSQTLMYPVAPSQFVPFDNISDTQKAMNIYADTIMAGSPLAIPYLLKSETLPKWSTVEPAAWQAAEVQFLGNNFYIGQTGYKAGDISSADLLNYLNSAYIQSGHTIDQAFGNISMLDKFELPQGYTNIIDYLIKNKISSSDVGELFLQAGGNNGTLPQVFSGSSTPVVGPPVVPTKNNPGSGINTGTGDSYAEIYNKFYTLYQGQAATSEGLAMLKENLGVFEDKITTLNEEITQAKASNSNMVQELQQQLVSAQAEADAANKAVEDAPEDV